MAMEEDFQVPVFSIWINSSIVKTLTFINKVHFFNQTETEDEEIEETFVLGRHPDSDIVLEHPSVSRRHLRIDSQPYSRHIFVTDLDSANGTRVSGRRIDSNTRTRVNEFDTLKIGRSRRDYKLQWISWSLICNISNPFFVPSAPLVDEMKFCRTPDLDKSRTEDDLDNNDIRSATTHATTMCSSPSPSRTDVCSETGNKPLGNGNLSPALSPIRRFASPSQTRVLLRLKTPFVTPPDSPTRNSSPSPSPSSRVTKSSSCSWFRGRGLCSDIHGEDSISSSSYADIYASDSPKFFRDLQKARRASLNQAKSIPELNKIKGGQNKK